MNFLSECSGIEAASVAWNPLGWKAVAFSEIEPFPCAVLAHHYPTTPNLGDMTKFKDWPDDLSIDLLCGGTPCQSFSVAGLRKGLDDPRGNLMLTYGATAAKYRPRWLVWENVPGVLSSNGGRDFGSFLGLLGQLGYGFAYRVLDAQYFGVPQRRRRVFVVGCLGDWRAAAAVLFERHSLSGHPAPRRETRQAVAGSLTAGARKCDHAGSAAGQLVPQAYGGGANCQATEVATALHAHPGGSRLDFQTETFIAHSLRGEGFDASEDGTGRGTPLVPVVHPIQECMVSRANTKGTGTGIGADGDPMYTLQSAQPHGVAVLPFDTTQVTSAANRSHPKHGDPCHPLAAGAHAPAIAYVPEIAATMVARSSRGGGQTNSPGHQADGELIAFSAKDYGGDASYDLSPTLRAGTHSGSHANAGVMPAIAFQERGRDGGRSLEIGGEVAYALTAPGDGGRTQERNILTPTMQVRRLTPRECEALQGFEADYTLLPFGSRKKIEAEMLLYLRMTRPELTMDQARQLAADGPRYKALGNSWAVPVVRWIGERIQAVDALHVGAERLVA